MSTSRSTPSTSTTPVGCHRRDCLRDELDVRLLERGIERRGEDRPLPGIRVGRGDRLLQVGAVLEAPGDVVEAELRADVVLLGVDHEDLAAPDVLLEQPLQPEAFLTPAQPVREPLALLGREVAVTLGHHPARLALEEVDVLHLGLDGGDDLRRRRTGAHHGDDLVGEVVLVLPARRVELRPGEVVEAGPVGVAGHVEEPDAADEHVALVDGAVVERRRSRRGDRRPTSPTAPRRRGGGADAGRTRRRSLRGTSAARPAWRACGSSRAT